MRRLIGIATILAALVLAAPAGASQLWLAGDIGDDGGGHQCDVASLINLNTPTWVVPLGDLAYQNGSITEYNSYYDPCWGVYGKAGVPGVVKPVPGNHEYLDTPPSAGYRTYFGLPAAPAPLYYNWTMGGWNFIVLDSDAPMNGGATPSAQYTWLKNLLNANTQGCIAVFYHRPRYSSSAIGGYGAAGAVFTLLYNKHVDLVINGHSHTYERFDKITGTGALDPVAGVREIVVGTGGAPLQTFTGGVVQPGSVVRDETHWGALKLVTSPGFYTAKFYTTTNPSGPPLDTLTNVPCNA